MLFGNNCQTALTFKSGIDRKWPCTMACVHVCVVGLKQVACKNLIVLVLICVVNTPFASPCQATGVGTCTWVFQRPGGTLVPSRITLPWYVILTELASKIAVHPASQKVPIDSSA
jgi:hypothetical protein